MDLGTVKGKITADASGFTKATKESESALQKLQKTATDFAKNVTAAFSAGAVVKFAHEALTAQAEAEASINKLNLALANHGKLSEQATAKLRGLASEIQDTTTFSDTAVVSVEAMFASYGMGTEEIVRATQATVDFAAATGKDLNEAATVVARAFNGQTAGLEKLGIAVDDSMTKTQKYESALQQLEQRFAGAGAAATQTYSGALQQLTNALGSAQEAFGKFLGELTGGTKPFETLIGWAQKLSEFFGVHLVLALSEFRAQMLEVIAGVLDFGAKLDRLFAKIPGMKKVFDFEKDAVTTKDLADALRLQAAQLREQGNEAALAAGKTQKFSNATNVAKRAIEELTAEQKKLNAEMAAFKLASDVASVGIEAMQQHYDDFATVLRSNPLPGMEPGTTGFLDTPGSNLTFAQAEAARLAKYGPRVSIDRATESTNKWKQSLQGVVQLGVQIASMFADISGKAGAIGAALGGAAGGAIGGPAGAAVGGLLGGLIGSLFGRGKRAAEALKKSQDQALSSLEGLFNKWKQFRDEIMSKGAKGLADYFTFMANRTDLTAEQLKNLGVVALSVFNAMRKAGMSVVDILKMMGEALSKAAKAGVKIPAGPLGDLGKFQQFVEANEELVRAVEGLAAAFDAVRLGTRLSQEQFDAWIATGMDLFEQLIAQGATYEQALILMSGFLYRLKKAHDEWGLVVDEHTQKLIDDAEAMGLFEDMQDPMEQLVEIQKIMLAVLAEIAKVFGVDLPEAVQKYIDKMHQIPSPPGPPQIPSDPNQQPIPTDGPIPAADGFFGTVTRPTMFLAGESGPETVNITPGGGGGSNADILAALRRLERVLPKMTRDAVLMGRASK